MPRIPYVIHLDIDEDVYEALEHGSDRQAEDARQAVARSVRESFDPMGVISDIDIAQHFQVAFNVGGDWDLEPERYGNVDEALAYIADQAPAAWVVVDEHGTPYLFGSHADFESMTVQLVRVEGEADFSIEVVDPIGGDYWLFFYVEQIGGSQFFDDGFYYTVLAGANATSALVDEEDTGPFSQEQLPHEIVRFIRTVDENPHGFADWSTARGPMRREVEDARLRR